MDAPEKASSTSPPKPKRTIGQHAFNIFLWLVIIGAIAAAGIWFKGKVDKARNLEDSLLQDLKQPQKLALDAVAADSGAKEALGDDIQDAGGLGRDGSGELNRASTVLHFDVAGSKAKGRVSTTAADNGGWQITGDIEVKLSNGKTIKIPKPAEKPPDINLDL